MDLSHRRLMIQHCSIITREWLRSIYGKATTQIPSDLHQSLLCAAQQAKSSKSGQHRPYRQQNGNLALRLTEIARRARAQELKFASLGEGRQIGSLVKLDHLENRKELNNLQGYISGLDESMQRFTVILEDGTASLRCRKRTSKIQTRCPPPLKRWTSFTRLVSEELRKNSRSWRCRSDIMWHHRLVVNSWFSSSPDLKRQDRSIYHKYTTLTCEMQKWRMLMKRYKIYITAAAQKH